MPKIEPKVWPAEIPKPTDIPKEAEPLCRWCGELVWYSDASYDDAAPHKVRHADPAICQALLLRKLVEELRELVVGAQQLTLRGRYQGQGPVGTENIDLDWSNQPKP